MKQLIGLAVIVYFGNIYFGSVINLVEAIVSDPVRGSLDVLSLLGNFLKK